jgi:putative hydrolase of the HAD superfamily
LRKSTIIQAVVFDLDQTLIDRDATFAAFLEAQYYRYRVDFAALSHYEYIEAIQKFDNHGYTPKPELYALACQALQLPDVMATTLCEDFFMHYGETPIVVPHVHHVLNALKAHYVLGVVTNGRSRAQRAKLTQAHLAPCFDSVHISEEDGVKKPHRQIFEHCLYDLKVDAHHAVYVGDHPANDIEAAKRIGMFAIWVDNAVYKPPCCCDGTITGLTELPNEIHKIEQA